jgi:hypothetical protein
MAKIKEAPTRLPLPLSFVEGESFIRCLTAGETKAIADRCLKDEETGELANPGAYLDALVEAVVVGEDGAPLIGEGKLHALFDPWQREVRLAVAEVYTPAAHPKNSPAASASRAA